MKVYVNVGGAWMAVSCGTGDGKISALVDDIVERSKETGMNLEAKVSR